MMEKMKVVQIGVVHDHASQNLNALRTQTNVFEVLGYAVPEEETHLNTPSWCNGLTRYTVEEALALPGLQGVVVETGELHLTKYAALAAQRGLAVFMDKPGGIELVAFEQLITLVKEKHIPFHVGYMYRYNPAVRQLLTDIRKGKLGEIYSVEVHMDCFHNTQKRQWLDQFPGGMMFYRGCHLIDLIYQIQGEPDDVLPLNCATSIDGVTGQDYGMAVLKYPNGVSFAKTCAAEPGGFMRRQLVVCGSKGTVQLMPFEEYTPDGLTTTVRSVTKDLGNWHNDGEKTVAGPYDRYAPMLKAWADDVLRGQKNPYTPDYELALYKLMLRCCGMEGA